MEKTLVCPKCGFTSLETEEIETDENIICYYKCFNCGLEISDELSDFEEPNQERANILAEETEDEIQNLNFLLLCEELEGKKI